MTTPTPTLIRVRPQAVSLPADGALSRRFEDPRQHLPGRARLEDADYAGFERHALFHDVYASADGRAIEALGPPLVNLAKHVLPLRASLGHGVPLTHRMRRFDRATLHRFTLPRGLELPREPALRIVLATGWTADLEVRRTTLEPVSLQFTTLQKDNPAAWILDWLRYAASLGVERVLLYDNGSRDAATLPDTLAAAGLPLQLVWIDWPYAYGPLRSYYNQFAQATQNNHAHRALGSAEWTGHFDVDEYLVGPLADDLPARLASWPRGDGLLRLDSHWVPALASDGVVAPERADDAPPSVRDFAFRERAARGKAHKYIVRNARLRATNTHNARVAFGYRRRAVPEELGCFLHYKALTTHWRDYGRRGEAEAYDPALHVEDRRVVERLYDASAAVPASR